MLSIQFINRDAMQRERNKHLQASYTKWYANIANRTPTSIIVHPIHFLEIKGDCFAHAHATGESRNFHLKSQGNGNTFNKEAPCVSSLDRTSECHH
jgi:hypothetical protein